MANAGISDPDPTGSRTPDRDGYGGRGPGGVATRDVNLWAVFESAPDAYLLLAPDPPRFTMIAANEARLRATLTRREDVIGRPLFEVFPDNPTDPDSTGAHNLRASLHEVIRTGKPHRMTLQKYDIRTPGGDFEERFWDLLSSPVYDERGNLIFIIHRVEDVTEQVRSGTRLRILESVVTTANDAVVATEAFTGEHGPRIIYVNEAFSRLTGYRPEEVIGRSPRILQGPATDQAVVRAIRAALERGEAVRAELQNYRKDGSPFWGEASIAPVLDEGGKVVQWTAVLRETTERRMAEETALQLTRATAARKEEERARKEIESILESITDAFYTLDRDWRFTYVNRQAEQILRRSRAELIGATIWEAFPGTTGSIVEREYRRAMEDQTTAEFEASISEWDICVEVRAYPSPDALSVYIRDITGRKRAEQALRESEERYRLLVDMVPQNIWTTDREGNHTYFSRRWYEYTGAGPDELRGDGWLAFLHPDDRRRSIERWEHSKRTGETYSIEYRIRSASGEYGWFLGMAMPLRNEAGEIVEWFGTATDISERKRIEQERERLLAAEQKAHEQVTMVLESITDAFFAVDREWRFTYVNKEAERLVKKPRESLLGRTLWDEFPAAAGAAFGRQYKRAMREHTTVRSEEYYPPLDTWFDVRAFPTAEGLSVYFTNVTARRRAEEALRESEERYRLLTDMIPQHIWVTDPDGYHTYFSRRWYEYTGATPEETEGEGWLRLLHPDDREATLARWQQALQIGEPYAMEYRFLGADGNYCWFLGQATPLRDEEGRIIEWIGTLTDISEQKSLEQERERLLAAEQAARAEAERRREELERVSESRTRLMRGFTHDVKNPLGAADGYAQLLEEGIQGELTEKQRDSVRRIRRTIQTSLRLIHELLELARAETGQLDLESVPTDVTGLVREAVEDFRAQATAAGLTLELHASEALWARTDPVRVRQVLSNVLSNAVKYTAEGKIVVEAGHRANGGGAARGEWVAIRVTDSGPGIPPEKRETIFQEFTRLDPDAQHGAGVGLAISRRIARLLGGDITVESEVGRGSTFTILLPPAPAESGAVTAAPRP